MILPTRPEQGGMEGFVLALAGRSGHGSGQSTVMLAGKLRGLLNVHSGSEWELLL